MTRQIVRPLLARLKLGKTSRVPKKPLLEVPSDIPKDLVPIAEEAVRLHESSVYSSQGQFEQAKIWRGLNAWLGVPAAVAAVIAGGTGLSKPSSSDLFGIKTSIVTGILALIAGALSATLTTMNASRRTTQAQASANAFLQLQTQSRQFVLIDLRNQTFDDARQTLEGLTNTRDELNKTADPPSRISYRRSQKNIDKGGQTYEADASEGDGQAT